MRISKLDRLLINTIETGMSTASITSAEDLRNIVHVLERRPLIRWFTLRLIKSELEAAGFDLNNPDAIDWEGIAKFIATIAPIILELLRAFM